MLFTIADIKNNKKIKNKIPPLIHLNESELIKMSSTSSSIQLSQDNPKHSLNDKPYKSSNMSNISLRNHFVLKIKMLSNKTKTTRKENT